MDRLTCRPDEVAELLGLSRSSIYKLVSDGTLPSLKVGRSRRVSRDAVSTYVRQLEEQHAADLVASRAAQGFGPTVTDPSALADLDRIVRRGTSVAANDAA